MTTKGRGKRWQHLKKLAQAKAPARVQGMCAFGMVMRGSWRDSARRCVSAAAQPPERGPGRARPWAVLEVSPPPAGTAGQGPPRAPQPEAEPEPETPQPEAEPEPEAEPDGLRDEHKARGREPVERRSNKRMNNKIKITRFPISRPFGPERNPCARTPPCRRPPGTSRRSSNTTAPPYASKDSVQKLQPELRSTPSWPSNCKLSTLQQHPCAAVHVEKLPLRVAARVEVDTVVAHTQEIVDTPAKPPRRRSRRKTPSKSRSPRTP